MSSDLSIHDRSNMDLEQNKRPGNNVSELHLVDPSQTHGNTNQSLAEGLNINNFQTRRSFLILVISVSALNSFNLLQHYFLGPLSLLQVVVCLFTDLVLAIFLVCTSSAPLLKITYITFQVYLQVSQYLCTGDLSMLQMLLLMYASVNTIFRRPLMFVLAHSLLLIVSLISLWVLTNSYITVMDSLLGFPFVVSLSSVLFKGKVRSQQYPDKHPLTELEELQWSIKQGSANTVSYTHLTLPTNREV